MDDKSTSAFEVPSIAEEFVGAFLGDLRRTKRLLEMAEAFSRAPDQSLPKIAPDDAALEAVYRFLNNDSITASAMLAPHFASTADRCEGAATTLVLHDITELSYTLEEHLKTGCGLLGMRQGFRLAPSLAVTADGARRPLGLLNHETWVVETSRKKRPGKKKRGNTWGRTEWSRWFEFAEKSEIAACGKTSLIHVMDREAGTFELLANMVGNGRRFVIRLMKNRTIGFEDERANVHDVAAMLEASVEVNAELSRRKAKYLKQGNPPREARTARLTFAAKKVRFFRTPKLPKTLPEWLDLNLVVVREPTPPLGVEPVEWLLVTTESVSTPDAITRVVDSYRARWTIEEYFKALKTGCRIQDRQLESLGALERVLAIFMVIAWKILLVRSEARTAPDRPASSVLSEAQIQVLRSCRRRPLPENPTVRDALLSIAALGGHIKNNGEPGWLVLSRGMETLFERVVGFVTALQFLGAAKM